VFETLGIAGIAIAMLAYVPQVVHLGREHCSAGVSRRAWMMWLASSVLVGSLAIHRGDLVFWKGHVGIIIDGENMIHANGHAMAVVIEPLAAVVARIGSPSSMRRLG